MTAPAKMLPKRRSERVRGLTASSRMLSGVKMIRTARGSSKGLVNRRRYQRQRQRLVEVGIGTVKEREDRERKDLNPVGHQDEEEERHRERNDEQCVL